MIPMISVVSGVSVTARVVVGWWWLVLCENWIVDASILIFL